MGLNQTANKILAKKQKIRRPPNIIHAEFDTFTANHFMHVYNYPDCPGTCTLSSLNVKYHLFYKLYLFASEIQFECSIETCTHILLIIPDIVNHIRLHMDMISIRPCLK